MSGAFLWGLVGRVVARHRRRDRAPLRHLPEAARADHGLRRRRPDQRRRLRARRRGVRTSAGSGGVGARPVRGRGGLLRRRHADRPAGRRRTQAARAARRRRVRRWRSCSGIVLDGIPESIVIGLSLLEGGGVSVALIAAVFLSNLPEAIAATTGLARAGWTRRAILGLWTSSCSSAGFSSLLGLRRCSTAPRRGRVAFVLAFAGGAILTMLADTMMPEAFEHGGKLAGLRRHSGSRVAFVLTTLE